MCGTVATTLFGLRYRACSSVSPFRGLGCGLTLEMGGPNNYVAAVGIPGCIHMRHNAAKEPVDRWQ
jgi:hypothetical protein